MPDLRRVSLLLAATLSVAADPAPSAPEAQLSWVLAGLTTTPAEAEITAHFTEAFRAAVPNMGAVFTQLAAQTGGLTLVRIERETPSDLVALVKSEKSGFLRVSLSVEPEGTRMAGLLFQPAPDQDPKPESWAAVDASLRAIAPKVSLLAADLAGDKCTPIHALEAGVPMAIGSTFKLYILDELAHQVGEGRRAWTEPMPIADAGRSLPSGDMRNAPANSTFTLQHYAEQMISVSDNTATDHLLFKLGRKDVEAAAARASNVRNAPFLSTREMFAFKLLLDDKAQQKYLAASPEKRRKLLDKTHALSLDDALAAAASWTAPRHIDTVEWFATANELCQEALALRSYGAASPVRRVLAINPGVPDTDKQWTYIGYKGGSEPGVLNLTWILERADGRAFFLTASFNDERSPIDPSAGIAAAAAARAFLAGTP